MITVTGANTLIAHCNINNILFILILAFLRSSPPEVFLGGGVLKISCKFIEHPYQGPCQNCTQHGCSPLNGLHIFRTHFSKYTSEGLLLILPISGMNYPLIHDIKVSFLLVHCYTLLGMSKSLSYILHIIVLDII